jgi:hypothetical protein
LSIAAVFAAKPADPNCFGEGASQFRTSGTMGTHSRAGSFAGEPPFDQDGEPGRQGIGNVGGNQSSHHTSSYYSNRYSDYNCPEL